MELRESLKSKTSDSLARPSTETDVNIFYSIRSLQYLDITQQEMSATGWTSMYWSDPRLSWNEQSYGNIESVELMSGWRPVFAISNSNSDKQYGLDTDQSTIRVFSSGQVRWVQILLTKTSCDVDISKFPFDTQTCGIEFIFPSMTMDELSILKVGEQNGEWIYDGSSTEKEGVALCCPETGAWVFRVKLTFTRRRTYYVMNLIIPTFLLSVCMAMAFMLPTESGERVGLALTILLAYTVQLSIVAQFMPTTSKQVPHIGRYLLMVLVLCCFVTGNIVIQVKMYYLKSRVCSCVKIVYMLVYPFVFLACCLCCCGRRKSRTDKADDFKDEDVNVDNATDGQQRDSITWADVSVLLDRVGLFLYIGAVSVLTWWLAISIW